MNRVLQNWSSENVDQLCKDWVGVGCEGSKVTRLDLSFMGLKGTIHNTLFSLTHLQEL